MEQNYWTRTVKGEERRRGERDREIERAEREIVKEGKERTAEIVQRAAAARREKNC